MPFNKDEFLADLLKEAKISDDQKAALGAALSDPTVAKRLEEGQLRQSDYSRLSAEAQQRVNEARTYYNELKVWKEQEATRIEQERSRYLGNQGTQPTGQPVQASQDLAGYITKDEYDKKLLEVQSGAVQYLSVLNDKSIQYYQEFGKPLDTAAVLRKAQEEGTNFLIAYDRYTSPDREAKNAKAMDERIKKEREDAVLEFQKNQSLPSDQPSQTLMGGAVHVLDALANKGNSFGWKAAADAHTRDIMTGQVKHE